MTDFYIKKLFSLRMIRGFIAILLSFLVSQSVLASVSYGIGANVQNSTTTFSMPIKFDGYFIEPRLSYAKYDYTNNMSGANSTTTYFDTGLFLNKELQEKASVYYGARLGYQKYDGSSTQNTYIVAPTIGIEVFPIKQASIGIEYRLQYSKMDASSYDNTTIRSISEVIFRYYFN